MRININEAANGKPISFYYKGKIFNIPESYSVDGNVDALINGEIYAVGEKFCFTGAIKASANLKCDLCLKTFPWEAELNIKEYFVKDSNSDDNCWSFESNVIDLEPAILSVILSSLPMKAICSENCRGLCPICGANLNDGLCNCSKDYINPQFERLKFLFENKEV